MRKILLGVVITLVILFTFKYCGDKKKDRILLQENTALIQEQIKNVGKLVVTEGHFSEVFTYKNSKAVFADLLEAINITHVDWMILDVEGHEAPILLSFPWRRVTVDLIQVEVIETKKVNLKKIGFLKLFLENLGFVEQPSLRLDMLFTRAAAGFRFFHGFKFSDKLQFEKYDFYKRAI